MDSRHNNGVSSDPDIVTDGHADAVLVKGVAGDRMNRVPGSVDRYVWRHLAVVTNLYFCNVYDRTVIVCKEVFPDFDVGAVITVERRIDKCSVRLSEQFFDNLTDLVKIRTVDGVQALQDLTADFLFFHYGIIGNISHFFVSSLNIIHFFSFFGYGDVVKTGFTTSPYPFSVILICDSFSQDHNLYELRHHRRACILPLHNRSAGLYLYRFHPRIPPHLPRGCIFRRG